MAVTAAKALSLACRLAGKQGVTMAGSLALRIDPHLLRDLAAQVRSQIIVVCGTNGKTTINNLLCSFLEAEGKKVICNHTGSNMLPGVAAAFALSAGWTGNIDADYACIEIDEASTVRVFPHFLPDLMVISNLFRDQLDRYGEIDITMDLLLEAIAMAPQLKLLVNADDSLVAYLAKESGRETVTFGITEKVFEDSEKSVEVREGRFCKCCGALLSYTHYHYSQLGVYSCPACGFARPAVDYEARGIDMRSGLDFDIIKAGKQADSRHIHADYRGFYNIYNILAAYAAGRETGLALAKTDSVLAGYNPQNGRNERFVINGTPVLLNLAKNPAGFNQNISSVMEDEKDKDIIIVINDNAQDGTDISWLWDVDFDRFADPGIRSITVSGLRCQDMRLRLKYVDIPSMLEEDVKTAITRRLEDGCGNLYVLVNYTALYSTHLILKGMQGQS